MKKRIIALLMASMMAMSMVACGNVAYDNSKEAEALLAEIEELKAENDELKNEEEKTVEEKVDVTDDSESDVEEVEEPAEDNSGDLWGTKRPVSAKLTVAESGIVYDGSFEFDDDGSYVAIYRHDASSYSEDHKYFYKSNGMLFHTEEWRYDKEHPDGNMKNEDYCLFGQTIASSDYMNVCPCGAMVKWAYIDNLKGIEFTYDENGNINNPEGELHYSEYYLAHLSPSSDYSIEYDEQGRVSKFTSPGSNNPFDIVVWEVNYIDESTIEMSHYFVDTDGYDAATRSYGEVRQTEHKHLIITFNEHGVPQYLCGMKDEQEGTKYEYIYDDYGFVTSIIENGKVKSTIEYSYE